MSAASAPHCKLCGKDHWAREGCDFSGKKTVKMVAEIPPPFKPKKVAKKKLAKKARKKK